MNRPSQKQERPIRGFKAQAGAAAKPTCHLAGDSLHACLEAHGVRCCLSLELVELGYVCRLHLGVERQAE